MSWGRCKTLLAALHVVDSGKDDPLDKLKKVSPVVASVKEKCNGFYQLYQNITSVAKLDTLMQIKCYNHKWLGILCCDEVSGATY